MKLITPPLIIDEQDSFANDVLDRKVYGQALRNLVVNSDDALVISLDGKWGEGKTTFVKMWQGLLNEDKIPNVYIDSFANDYVDDAFISVASAITNYAENNIKEADPSALNDFKDKAKKVGTKLLPWTARVGIKAVTLGIIKDSDIDVLTDIQGDLSSTASNLVGNLIEDRLNSHAEDIEMIESFKVILSELPSKLQAAGEDKPLVIIIDELDRCRPTFAVELVEKIKHLFSVENVVFLLVMNKEQLEESIKCIYGQNIDAHTYLQKFVNLEMQIPKYIDKMGYSPSDIKKYTKNLIQIHELEDTHHILSTSIENFAQHLNLSLRQLEKVTTNLAIYYSSNTFSPNSIIIITFVSIVKVTHPNLFKQFLNNKVFYSQIQEKLNFEDINLTSESSHQDRNWSRSILWIKAITFDDREFDVLREENPTFSPNLNDLIWNERITHRQELIPHYAKKMNMFNV